MNIHSKTKFISELSIVCFKNDLIQYFILKIGAFTKIKITFIVKENLQFSTFGEENCIIFYC